MIIVMAATLPEAKTHDLIWAFHLISGKLTARTVDAVVTQELQTTPKKRSL
jgi:hypothetical protein